MRVLYDHQVFWLQQYGGISRYYVELMSQLQCRERIDPALALWYSENRHLLSSTLVRDGLAPSKPPIYELVKKVQTSTKRDLIGFFDFRASKRALKKGDFDLFHPTYYYPYFLNYLKGKPFVLTVYDMTHEVMPELFAPNNPTMGNKKMLAERAEKVIAISHSTKNDLVRICGIDPSKVSVVHLASPLDGLTVKGERPSGLPDQYVLFIGNRGGYKNFTFLVEAMVGLLKVDQTMHIVCGGGAPFSEDERTMFREKGIEDRVIQFPVDDSTLVALYRGARAFVYPSLYEGFGLPILEAFGCGCPVIASNRSSFPEIAGDAGLYFDPSDMASLENTIYKVITDECTRARMIERGYARAKNFSWERMTEETIAVYRTIA